MKRLALIALALAACAPDERPTVRYWSCDEATTCAEGTTCTPAFDAAYCTTACDSHDDCTASGWPSVCVEAGVCMGECWPSNEGEEDLAFCRKYGFLCESDCDAQGLRCDPVGTWPPRYSCI